MYSGNAGGKRQAKVERTLEDTDDPPVRFWQQRQQRERLVLARMLAPAD